MPPASDESPQSLESDSGAEPGNPIQFCPYCGENIGSFWGRRSDDGIWCESCAVYFTVARTDA